MKFYETNIRNCQKIRQRTSGYLLKFEVPELEQLSNDQSQASCDHRVWENFENYKPGTIVYKKINIITKSELETIIRT